MTRQSLLHLECAECGEPLSWATHQFDEDTIVVEPCSNCCDEPDSTTLESGERLTVRTQTKAALHLEALKGEDKQ